MQDFQEMKIHVLSVLGETENIDKFIKMLESQTEWCKQNKEFYTEKKKNGNNKRTS